MPATKDNTSERKKTQRRRVSRRTMLIVLIGLILVVDSFFGVAFLLSGKAPVSTDPEALIRSQLVNNHNGAVGHIWYDPNLTFANWGAYVASVDVNTLQPLSNNYLSSVKTDSGQRTVLIDETAVARIISASSNWVALLNNNSPDGLAADVLPGSKAELFFNASLGDSLVFQNLVFGEIQHNGPRVYVLVQCHYTLLRNGEASTVNSVFLFKLIPQSGTLVISDIEQLNTTLPTAPSQ